MVTIRQPIERQTSATILDRGPRTITLSLHPHHLELRAKGLRQRYPLDYTALYCLAVKNDMQRRKAEKIRKDKAK